MVRKGRIPMASYFVACRPQPDGTHAVHDRDRCPPPCFFAMTEYLGEFLDARQAAVVARVRYAGAVPCAGHAPMPRAWRVEEPALTPLRP
jgi:hypothetical protein